jgi:hypothetical protein
VVEKLELEGSDTAWVCGRKGKDIKKRRNGDNMVVQILGC